MNAHSAFAFLIAATAQSCAGTPPPPSNREVAATPPSEELSEPEPSSGTNDAVATDAGAPADAAPPSNCKSGEVRIVRDGDTRSLQKGTTEVRSEQHAFVELSYVGDNVVVEIWATEPAAGMFKFETFELQLTSKKPDKTESPTGFRPSEPTRKMRGSIWYRPPGSASEHDEFVNLDAPIEITKWGNVDEPVEGTFGPFVDTARKRKGKFSGTFRVCRVPDRHVR